jgi:hypothetical protein
MLSGVLYNILEVAIQGSTINGSRLGGRDDEVVEADDMTTLANKIIVMPVPDQVRHDETEASDRRYPFMMELRILTLLRF